MTASDIIQIVITVGVVQIIMDIFFNWYIFNQPPYQRALDTVQRTKIKLQQYQIQLQNQQVVQEEKTASTSAASNNKNATTKKGSVSASSSGAMKKKNEKNSKKHSILESDYKEAVGVVASLHVTPNIISTLIFLIVLRILGTEYSGHVVAVLPFEPIPFVRRLTHRGLNYGLPNVKELSNLIVLVPSATDATATVTTAEKIVTISASSDDSKKENDGDNNNEGTKQQQEKVHVRSAAQACSFMFLYMLSTISIKFYIHKLIGVQPPSDSQGLMSILESTTGQRLLYTATGMDANDIVKNLK